MATNRNSTYQNPNPPIPQDQYGEAGETLFDPATGGLVVKRAVNVQSTTVNGKTIKYGDESVSVSSSAPTDIVATGNLTAAQPTVGTVVAGGTVSIALGTGQGTVEAQLTGTFSSGTTIIFEGTDDAGTTTNWFTTFGNDTTVANAPNISSVAGPGPFLIRIPSAGYEQIRTRCNPFHTGDNVAVRLIASVAGSGGANLATNDGSFAKETGGNLASLATNTSNIATVEGATTDVAVVGDVNGSVSAKLRGLSKIFNDVWDSVNHFLLVKATQSGTWTVQPGNTANTTAWKVDGSTVTQPASIADGSNTTFGAEADAAAAGDSSTATYMSLFKRLLAKFPTIGPQAKSASVSVTFATDNPKAAVTAASGDFADGAIATLGAKADTAITDATTTNSQMSFVKGFVKILNDIWDSTNHLLHINNKQIGGTAISVNAGNGDAGTQRMVIASDQGAVQVKRSSVAAYTLASTTTSGTTQNSGDITVGAYTEISIDINTTAQAGTSPTIQYFWERKGADGIYYILWQTNVLTAATNTLSTSIGAGMAYNQSLGLTGRLRWVIGGTSTPTFTHSLNCYGK